MISRDCNTTILVRALFALVCLPLMWIPGGAHGHALEQSYLYLDMNHDVLKGRFEMTVADLNRALSLDLSLDGDLEPADLAGADLPKGHRGASALEECEGGAGHGP